MKRRFRRANASDLADLANIFLPDPKRLSCVWAELNASFRER